MKSDFENEFKEQLVGLDYLTIKKLEYEFNRWKAGLGKRLKLSLDETMLLHCIKEKARKDKGE